MILTIPDEVYLAYQAHSASVPPEQLLNRQLNRFKGINPLKRAIVLGAADLERIEAQTGGIPLKDGEDLVARLDRLASIHFHGIRLDFTPGQLEEIQYRAERQGRPVEVVVAEMIQAVLVGFFHGSNAPSAIPPPSLTPARITADQNPDPDPAVVASAPPAA